MSICSYFMEVEHLSIPHFLTASTSSVAAGSHAPSFIHVSCHQRTAKHQPQLMGQLPLDCINPGPVFDTVGVDYAGPLMVKNGYVHNPTLIKAYICVFVSLTVRAVHLEPVSDLISEAFITTLTHLVARCGKPSLLLIKTDPTSSEQTEKSTSSMNFCRRTSHNRISWTSAHHIE